MNPAFEPRTRTVRVRGGMGAEPPTPPRGAKRENIPLGKVIPDVTITPVTRTHLACSSQTKTRPRRRIVETPPPNQQAPALLLSSLRREHQSDRRAARACARGRPPSEQHPPSRRVAHTWRAANRAFESTLSLCTLRESMMPVSLMVAIEEDGAPAAAQDEVNVRSAQVEVGG